MRECDRTRREALDAWKQAHPPTFLNDYIWFVAAAVILGLDFLVAR